MFETGFVYMFPIIFIEMLWESKNKFNLLQFKLLRMVRPSQNIHCKISKHKSSLLALEITNLFRSN